MAAATNWLPASDATITINSVVQYATTAEFSVEVEEFETTNTESEGDYEMGMGVTKRRLRLTLALEEDKDVPAERTLYTCSYADGKDTYSGTAGVVRASRRGGGRGGLTAEVEVAFTGAVTKS
jgi:hypothetical protein